MTRRPSLLLRLLIIPATIIAGIGRNLADWYCSIVHSATEVRPISQGDGNRYWECDCGRRMFARAASYPNFKGGYSAPSLAPDWVWLDGGAWRSRMKPPKGGSGAMTPRRFSKLPGRIPPPPPRPVETIIGHAVVGTYQHRKGEPAQAMDLEVVTDDDGTIVECLAVLWPDGETGYWPASDYGRAFDLKPPDPPPLVAITRT